MIEACIPWGGRVGRDGYGRCSGANGSRMAHRTAYEREVGPIPAGWTVDHICFNKLCVNPDHLRILTVEQNARRQRSARKEFCSRGHEYTPENTYIRPLRYREGVRDCRTCIRERVARYKQRIRGAA